MGVTRRVAVVEDPRYLEHRSPPGHPERPERLAAVGGAIAARRERLAALGARAATDEELIAVHPPAHLRAVEAAARSAPAHLDPDTFVSAASFEIARLAAGGSVECARAVATGRAESALAAVRPPGHHAEAARAMGFCLFNNVAVAARALRLDGVERILVLDWDVHHGNGTQHVFEDDPDVLYFSMHQFPFYPGTGDFVEAGRGRGLGATVNVPLPPGCGDLEYTGVMRRVLVPVALSFRPEVLLVSCGFDAHRDDPLASMVVTGAGFAELARIARALAEAVCGGRVAFILEGGYSPNGLAEGTAALLDVLLEPETPDLAPLPLLEPGSALAHVISQVAQIHKNRYPRIG
jgi:acetoin utilization deacetylase AcuC-like enzyme